MSNNSGKMIPAINSVEGFNPSDFVRMNTGEDGSNDAYLDAKYAYFDAKVNTHRVLGRAMNNYKFGFKRRTVNGISEYWLQEK